MRMYQLIQTFWASILRWLNDQVNIDLQYVTIKDVVLGVDDLTSAGRITNFILLHFRFYIHRQRLFHDNKFELIHWLAELRLRLSCMRYNLQQEGKVRRFKPWEPLFDALG